MYWALLEKLTPVETDVHNLPIQSHLSHAGFDRWDKVMNLPNLEILLAKQINTCSCKPSVHASFNHYDGKSSFLNIPP